MGWGRGPTSDTPVGGAGTTALATSPTGPLAASRYPAMADALAGVGAGGATVTHFPGEGGSPCQRHSSSVAEPECKPGTRAHVPTAALTAPACVLSRGPESRPAPCPPIISLRPEHWSPAHPGPGPVCGRAAPGRAWRAQLPQRPLCSRPRPSSRSSHPSSRTSTASASWWPSSCSPGSCGRP